VREQDFRKIKAFMSQNIQQLSRMLKENEKINTLSLEAENKIQEDLRILKENRDDLVKIAKQTKLDLLHSQAVAIRNDMQNIKKRIATPSVYSIYNLRSISTLKKTRKKKGDDTNFNIINRR
jgi:DNA-binding protein H-NS